MAASVELTWHFSDGRIEKAPHALIQEGEVQRLRLAASDIPTGARKLDVRPNFAEAKTGEEGYFVMPNGYLGSFRKQEGTQSLRGNCMPMFGMKTPRTTFVGIVTGRSNDYTLIVQAKEGVYTIFPRFELDERARDDIAIEYHMLSGEDADYSGMARTYRKYQLDRGACRSLKERIKESPELAYSAKSVEVRIRLGWKPAPSPVEEQTLETEPPMKVAVTFDRVGEILDEFQKQGVENAQICLVGWNRKGHDGRYPQLFPVEEALGGEAKLRQLIKKAQKMGFQIVGHTNSSDAYGISNVWDEEYLIKKPDGTLSKNASWSGGRMYNVCPQRAFERFVPKDLQAVAGLGFRGVHYIDVVTIVPPRSCFDPRHPLTRDESAMWVGRIMKQAKDTFGGAASEGGYDFCCGNLDYALYISFADWSKLPDMVDRLVPIWQLVYHGIILSNPFSITTNYTIKGDSARLKMVEFGGRPMFYFHSKFKSNNKNWMGDEDITCENDEALIAGVAAIKEGHDEYGKLRHLQPEFMENHSMLAPEVFLTAYSDGTEIISNYSEAAFTYKEREVAPLRYILLK